MNPAALVHLARAISAVRLYEGGHPAREQVLEEAARRLEATGSSSATFLDGEVVINGVPQPELRDWSWGRRLEEAGIQRMEVRGKVLRTDMDAFLNSILERLASPEGLVAEARFGALRYGPVGVEEANRLRPATLPDESPEFTLREEVAAMAWVLQKLQEGGSLDLLEVDLMVRSLMASMKGGDQFLIPLVRLADFDEYTTSHSLNVAVLSMALAEFLELESAEIRGIGVAGVLHDIGKVKVPREILVKPGRLSPEEMDQIRRHPGEGARMILESDERLDLAVVVAYEHHIWYRSGGYPSLHYPRKCHPASNLLHVCDVYDAFATDRPYREAWQRPRILAYIDEAKGTEFDPFFATAFQGMMTKRWDSIAEIRTANTPLPLSAPGGGKGGAASLSSAQTPEPSGTA
jgi:putative nucleotidyltransferase with HDIG domain